MYIDVQNGLLHKNMDEDQKEIRARFNEKYLRLDNMLKGHLEYQEESAFEDGT